MADVDWAIQKAFLHAQRKANPPATGTAKYNALLGIADSMQKLWASEPGTEWDSLYDLVQLAGTVTTTDTFLLTSTIASIGKREGDYVRLTNGTNTVRYRVVKPNQLYQKKDENVCAQIGSSLVFPDVFAASSALIGYNIVVPAILKVGDLTTGTDTIQVDDPMWLVYMMAAEFVRNDVVKVSQYNNLLTLADQVMQKMKDNNEGQVEEIDAPWQPAGESWV